MPKLEISTLAVVSGVEILTIPVSDDDRDTSLLWDLALVSYLRHTG